MNKLILNPEYGLYEKNGQPFCDSLQVAETFKKRHDSVLRDVGNVMKNCGGNFELHNFVEITYKDQRNRKQPKYLLSKDGFTLLVMGYTGKKAMQFKIAYINRFNQMENFIKSLLATKEEFPAFTEAVLLAHSEPKHYHFSNEINMIYRIVLGMDAKTFREQRGIDKGASIRPYLSSDEIKLVEQLQRADIGLLVSMPMLEQRKFALTNYYNRLLLRLTA
ncbi:MAG: hypothetical protein EP149_09590 [Phascolarctobacterium sp.]|nr:Rha family transcriptional regulator [Phascolarctobacterium sp.]MUU07895.1 hypothetical protein [Phascolarctobacterium sp.]MUU17538.1 hypothetical protein [Phascolarctobacterium sp.]